MPRYRLTFVGRRVGAIGIFYRITAEREAATIEAARLALYDEYEHLHHVGATVIDGDEPATTGYQRGPVHTCSFPGTTPGTCPACNEGGNQ